jgi:hypothetical protein
MNTLAEAFKRGFQKEANKPHGISDHAYKTLQSMLDNSDEHKVRTIAGLMGENESDDE